MGLNPSSYYTKWTSFKGFLLELLSKFFGKIIFKIKNSFSNAQTQSLAWHVQVQLKQKLLLIIFSKQQNNKIT